MFNIIQGIAAGSIAPPPIIDPPSELIPVGTPVSFIGDSMTYGDGGQSHAWWYYFTLGIDSRLYFPQTLSPGTNSASGTNSAVAGQTTAQIAARAATFNTHDGVYFIFMGQNDNASVTAEQQQANFETIFTELSDALKIFVVPFAETSSVYASATIQNRNATNISWLEGIDSTYPNVVLLPASVQSGINYHDGSGGIGSDTHDGVHPKVTGAYKLGTNIAAAVLEYLDDGDGYDLITELGFATNLYAADFTGTGGSAGAGSSGQVATGLALTTSNTTGLTVTASKGTLDGMPSQIITITGTAPASSTVQVQLRETAAHNFLLGEGFTGVGRIKITGSDGVSTPQGGVIGFNCQGGGHIFMSQFGTTPFGGLNVNIEGIFITNPVAATGSGSSINMDLVFRAFNSATVDYRIEIADVKVFNSTQELAA